MQKINKTILLFLLVSFGAIPGHARPVSSEGIALMAEDAAIGMSVGNLNSNFTLPGEAAEDSNTTTLDDNFTLVDKPNNKIPNPKDPNTMALITEWVRIAEPPINATDGAHTKYEPWGRAVGSTKTATLQATGKPDDVGGRSSSEYLWSMRDRLDSVNHCKLGEYVIAKLDKQSIAHCKGRYKATDTKQLVRIEKEIDAIQDFAEKSNSKCKMEQEVLDKLQKQIVLEKNSFLNVKTQINDLIKRMSKTKKTKKQLVGIDKNIEQLAVEIEKKLSDLDMLSSEVCNKTKTLNDYNIDDNEHAKTFKWIVRNKNEFKIYLDQIKAKYKEIESYEKTIVTLSKGSKRVKTEDISLIEKRMKKMNTISKKIDVAVSKVEKVLLHNIKNTSIIYSRKQAVKRSLKSLDGKSGAELKLETSKLYKQLSKIGLSRCSKEINIQIKSLSTSSREIGEKTVSLTQKLSETKKEFKEYEKNIEKILSLENNRKTILFLVEKYFSRAKKFTSKGASCTVQSKEIMKKVFVPKTIGMKLERALYILRNKGLNNVSVTKTEEAPSKALEKNVLTQNTGTTMRVNKGTKIILTHYGSYASAIENLIAQKNCSKNTTKVWNETLKKVDCVCRGPVFVWNKRGTACITQREAELEEKNNAMAQANCSQRFPNSKNSWNSKTKQVDCMCVNSSLVWNNAFNACITVDQSKLENANCQYGKVAILDNGIVKCQCPQRTWWVDSLGKCANSYEMTQDCKYRFPGSIPANNPSGCACPNGTTWLEGMNKCANLNQISQFCNQQFPGSIPQWDSQNNKQGCGCPQGTIARNNRCIQKQKNPYVSPQNVKQGQCNNAHKAGRKEAITYLFNLGGANSFKLKYDTKTYPDRIVISQGGNMLFDSRCVGTKGTKIQQIYKNSNSSQVQIDILPNCDGKDRGTSWNFTVVCPK